MAKYKLGPIFTPPVVSKLEGPLAGFRSSGGTNWPGGSYDPETHVAFVPSFKSFPTVALMRPPSREFSDVDWVEGFADRGVHYVTGPGEDAGADAPARGPGAASCRTADGRPAHQRRPLRSGAPGGASADDDDGRSGAEPESAGAAAAQAALRPDHGDQHGHRRLHLAGRARRNTGRVRNHPALRGLTIPRTGQAAAVGALVTKTLVIAGDPQATVTADHPRGAMLRAYDKATGKEVGAVFMPAPQSGTPMTYSINGRQHIVVAISGGAYSGEYVAFRLPRQ